MAPTRISILGSCASRDALGVASPHQLELIDYAARTSFASLAAKPFVVEAILDKIQSRFQREMVRRDMSKNFWNKLDTDKFDVMVIDLIDDRFQLKIFEDRTAHTRSAEYKHIESKIQLPPSRLLPPWHGERRALWHKGLKRFAKVMKQQAATDKVAINCVYWASDSGTTEAKIIRFYNDYLEASYAEMGKYFPESCFIRYPTKMLSADPGHKWGAAPFHYARPVYDYFLDQVALRWTPENPL